MTTKFKTTKFKTTKFAFIATKAAKSGAKKLRKSGGKPKSNAWRAYVSTSGNNVIPD